MTYRVLTRTERADVRVGMAVEAQATVERLQRDAENNKRWALDTLARYISAARREGVSLSELAHAFGKSPEWVRQAEKKGRAS
jgi:transposase-like protein